MLKNSLSGLLVGVSLALASLSAPALAQQPVELKGDVMVVKTVTDDAGETSEELVAPDVVVPGDRLIFSTSFTNNGAEAVENFVVNNPLPSAVRLAPDADPDLTVSVDGGATWGKLGQLQVTGEDGASRPAQADDVTHIRWTLAAVEPGQSGRLEYPAIIR